MEIVNFKNAHCTVYINSKVVLFSLYISLNLTAKSKIFAKDFMKKISPHVVSFGIDLKKLFPVIESRGEGGPSTTLGKQPVEVALLQTYPICLLYISATCFGQIGGRAQRLKEQDLMEAIVLLW